jgi:hypothetical protein
VEPYSSVLFFNPRGKAFAVSPLHMQLLRQHSIEVFKVTPFNYVRFLAFLLRSSYIAKGFSYLLRKPALISSKSLVDLKKLH